MKLDLQSNAIGAFLEPRHHALATKLESFVVNELPTEHCLSDVAARSLAPRIAQSLGRAGLLSVLDPLDLRGLCLVREAVAFASPLADAICALQGLGSMPLLLAGNETQRAYVRRVQAGDAIAAFAMTEAQAGSDVASLQCRAVEDGDAFILNGEKCFISNAGIADFYCVFASVDPDAGHRGIACFLVPATTPGALFAGSQEMSASHPLGIMAFRDCKVPKSALIGDIRKGFAIGMASLDRLRPSVGAAAVGMARRALDEAILRVTQRRQFGEALASFQLVQSKLAKMKIDLESARLLTYRAAYELDAGADRITMSAAIAKAHATEAAQRVIDRCVQLHGGSGCLVNSIPDQLYRSIRALRIYEGTTEIQELVIARHLLAQTSAST